MKAMMLTILLLSAWPTVATAQLPYEESRWRTETVINDVRYRLWIDAEAINPDAPGGRSPWPDLQLFARHFCFRCAPRAWGETEFNRAQMASDTKDQGYVPLSKLAFVPLNLQVVSGTLPDRRPAFRRSEYDSVIIQLRDGRVLQSLRSTDIPTPQIAVGRRAAALIGTCAQLERQLEGVTIFTRDELRMLWQSSKDRYGDKPWANIALVPIENTGRSFGPNDITHVLVVWQGQRISLTQNQMTASTR